MPLHQKLYSMLKGAGLHDMVRGGVEENVAPVAVAAPVVPGVLPIHRSIAMAEVAGRSAKAARLWKLYFAHDMTNLRTLSSPETRAKMAEARDKGDYMTMASIMRRLVDHPDNRPENAIGIGGPVAPLPANTAGLIDDVVSGRFGAALPLSLQEMERRRREAYLEPTQSMIRSYLGLGKSRLSHEEDSEDSEDSEEEERRLKGGKGTVDLLRRIKNSLRLGNEATTRLPLGTRENLYRQYREIKAALRAARPAMLLGRNFQSQRVLDARQHRKVDTVHEFIDNIVEAAEQHWPDEFIQEAIPLLEELRANVERYRPRTARPRENDGMVENPMLAGPGQYWIDALPIRPLNGAVPAGTHEGTLDEPLAAGEEILYNADAFDPLKIIRVSDIPRNVIRHLKHYEEVGGPPIWSYDLDDYHNQTRTSNMPVRGIVGSAKHRVHSLLHGAGLAHLIQDDAKPRRKNLGRGI